MGQVISIAEVSSVSECELMALEAGDEAVEDILQDLDSLVIRNCEVLVTYLGMKALVNLITSWCSLLQTFAARRRIV